MNSEALPYTNIGNVRLARNFELNEFLSSDFAEREDIDNTPSEAELRNLHLTAFALQHLRDLLCLLLSTEVSIKITSGFRSDALNKGVGGSDTSAHRKGLAADFLATTKGGAIVPAPELCSFIANSFLGFDQLIAYPGENRVHLGFASPYERPRRQLLTKNKGRPGYADGITIR